MRKALLLAALVLSLGIVAGCAGDDEPETSAVNAWAESFCTATIGWTDDLQAIAGDLSDLTQLSSTAISQAAEDAREVTDAYVSEVRDLGGPGTEGGDEIESSLEQLADDVEGEMDEIEDAVEDIDGLTGIVTAGREVAASVSAMFISLERAFETLETADPSGELETAFDETPACDEIAN